MNKQRQLNQNKELAQSFKNTTNLANALTKDRVQIQNDLQKISAGKHTSLQISQENMCRQGAVRGTQKYEESCGANLYR